MPINKPCDEGYSGSMNKYKKSSDRDFSNFVGPVGLFQFLALASCASAACSLAAVLVKWDA